MAVQQSGDGCSLPVYFRFPTDERVIAVTVDDCYEVDNLRRIVGAARNCGAKLTLFPIGENLSKPGMADLIRRCVFEDDFEIENHTWSHARIFRLPENEMAREIWDQGQALNRLLGVNYEQHFFRPMGGDGYKDQRIHNYLIQLGFKGVAHWLCCGTEENMDEIKKQLCPGAIYLFHTVDGDPEKVLQFIPYAISQGYRLVTLNALAGFEPNAMSAYAPGTMPVPRPYVDDCRACAMGDYSWRICRMQDRLRVLGLLDCESTGYFGELTFAAIRGFQQLRGLPVTGVADSETQRQLFEE